MSIAGTQLGTLRLSRREARRLALAFALSVAAHLLIWGGYELEKELQFWQLPAWMHLAKKKPTHPPPPLTQNQNLQPPLVFVDVNPEQATTEAPKDTKYYSNKNSRAANPTPSDTDTVKFTGKQTEMAKTENVLRPQFSKSQSAQPANQTQEASQPKPALNPGDLTLGNPQDELRQTQGDAEQQRPRTLKQALALANRLPGLQMQQDGGVQRSALAPSLDVKLTGYGDYDSAFIDAVTQRWFDLLDNLQYAGERRGKVVLQFRLNSDGSIADMKVLENTVGDVLGGVCEKAVFDPSPYAKWTTDMRLALGNSRLILFTFHYD